MPLPSGELTILQGVGFDIDHGDTVAIVGASGSGKTTLMQLLLGLLTPQAGEVLVDDVTLTPLNMRSWQNEIGFVPQSIYLLDDSVAANIAFGVPEDQVDVVFRRRDAAVLAG